MIWAILLLLLNFFISWSNAKYCGRYWSESKAVGGSFRAYVIAGYAMAIAGFTMVYFYLLSVVLPLILPLFMELSNEDLMAIMELSSSMLYILLVLAIVPSGFFIWFKSVANFWEHKTLGNGLVAGYNTFAQFRNTANACRELPSAFGRVTSALFGGKGKKKSETYIVLLAILLLILAIFSGYFTASAIMKKADREYDAFASAEEYYRAHQSTTNAAIRRRR
ncbi:MAG: hypothetical protein ACI4VN_01620 [Clostridia bacterium]